MGIDELVRLVTRLQQQVDNLIKPEVGRCVDWTPTVDQGGNVARTVNYAWYITIASTVITQVKLSITGAGAVGSVISIGGQPTTIQPANTGFLAVIGTGIVVDNSVGWYLFYLKNWHASLNVGLIYTMNLNLNLTN